MLGVLAAPQDAISSMNFYCGVGEEISVFDKLRASRGPVAAPALGAQL